MRWALCGQSEAKLFSNKTPVLKNWYGPCIGWYMNVLKLLFLIFIGLQFGCENVCDETVYGTNSDGTTYEECVVYND